MAVNKITDARKEEILKESARDLPDRPTERGYTAENVKKAFYKPTEDVMTEINRIAAEAQASIAALQSALTDGIDRIKNETGTEIASITGKIETGEIVAGKAVSAVTQDQSDASDKIATTGFVGQAVSNAASRLFWSGSLSVYGGENKAIAGNQGISTISKNDIVCIEYSFQSSSTIANTVAFFKRGSNSSDAATYAGHLSDSRIINTSQPGQFDFSRATVSLSSTQVIISDAYFFNNVIVKGTSEASCYIKSIRLM